MKNNINQKKKTVLMVICGLLTVLTIFVSIETAVGGMEIRSLDKKEMELVKAKKEYENNLAEYGSVSQLGNKSTELGFVKSSDVIYIGVPKPVAQLQ